MIQLNRLYKSTVIALFCFLTIQYGKAQTLDPWNKGNLDIHFINTGRGDCAFMIMPDGTTMLIDAGELNPMDARTRSPRTAPLQRIPVSRHMRGLLNILRLSVHPHG
ncbi:hypothetical protein [Chitinophaga pinensis]|uniref:Uncharacterized protein n=1 Tax=Chitinophaga pinensis TaxID=79329 RepID=A0A5C6LP39_9BACT|nr:hypothetical protein [Chitinophaga pinensis]TWV96895.1 hypothetical protein FEF09_22665 [Chitinophaga pinensis]